MKWDDIQKRLAESPYMVRLILAGVFYYLGARLGLYLSFSPSNIGALWPPNAILLTALLTQPRRQWWGYFLVVLPAELAADIPVGITPVQSLFFLFGDFVEVSAAALLLRAMMAGPLQFRRMTEMLAFLAAAVVVGPFLGAIPGAMAGGMDLLDPGYWIRVRTWMLSDALTHVSMTPLLVVLFGPSGGKPRMRPGVSIYERVIVAASLVAGCYILFGGEPAVSRHPHTLFYLPIPILFWIAMRFGPTCSFASGAVIAVIAVWNASRGHGPFAASVPMASVVDLQGFLLLSLAPIALLAVAITERKETQGALQSSEEKYRLLVNNAGDMVVKVDPEGRFLFVSPEYCRVFGKSEDELVGHTFMPTVHEDDRASTAKAMEALTVPPHTCYVEQRALTRNGWRWIAWRDTAVLDDQGNVESIIGVGRDIQSLKEADEERERLRERLSRAEKMEALNLLAGGVAHDLNNILSGIISYPDLLLLDLPADDEMREPLETIRESGFRAAAVVRDMAGLSKVMDINAALIPASLSRIMAEYLASSEHEELLSRYPDVQIQADLDPGVLSVSCAPVLLRRAVTNLILNAVEIAQPEGTVAASAHNRYLDEPLEGYEDSPAGEYVVLEVSDSGKQVSEDDLPRIFDPFFTRKVLGWGGTGLGLTVVWNVVHDHGGFVDVTSTEQGTTFTLYLPATRAVVPEAGEAESVQDYRGNGEHILVVDDEPAQRRIARHILERLNYRVETEESGEAAIKHLESFPVDLVLLDMIMPRGMDGRETYRCLCDLQPGIKAVVASGFAHVDAIQAMRKAGVNRYIEKPYTLARLGREVYAELHSD